MRAGFKYHHLNNIKVDLQDKKMTLLGDSLQTHLEIHRIKDEKEGEENCLYPALVYNLKNDSS